MVDSWGWPSRYMKLAELGQSSVLVLPDKSDYLEMLRDRSHFFTCGRVATFCADVLRPHDLALDGG